MTVRAHYSDGSVRDVTSLALFLSSNDTSAKISPDGLVTAGGPVAGPGEAAIMVGFLSAVDTFRLMVPRSQRIERRPGWARICRARRLWPILGGGPTCSGIPQNAFCIAPTRKARGAPYGGTVSV